MSQEALLVSDTLRTIIGIVAPIAAYAALAVPLGAMEAHGSSSTTSTWLFILCLVATSTLGFIFTTRRLTRWQSLAVAVVYYPIVLALSFYASLIVVGRLYDNFL
jgi:hypothetical protein